MANKETVSPSAVLPLPKSAEEEPTLSEAELRARIETTERSVMDHLAGLANELAPGSFMLGNRPVMDRVRLQPILTVVVALSLGAALSVLLVAPRKRRKPPKKDMWRQVLDRVSDKTGVEVLRGSDLPESLRDVLGDRTPVVLVNSSVGVDGGGEEPSSSLVGRAASAAIKTAIGFAAKAAIDLVAEEARASIHKQARPTHPADRAKS